MNYLCDEHFESLAGRIGTWSYPVATAKCIVCGRNAIYHLESLTLKEDALTRYIVCINNEVQREYEIEGCTIE